VQAGGELAGLRGGGLGPHQLLERVQQRHPPVAGRIEQAGQRVGGCLQAEVGQVAAQPLVGGRRVVRRGGGGDRRHGGHPPCRRVPGRRQ
jgi:hypothetical protein